MTPLMLLATTPAPDPVEMEIWEVTPGIEGFLWGFLLLAVLAVPLFLSLVKHMRRVDHNARVRQREEEEAAAAAAAGDAAPGAGDARVLEGVVDSSGPGAVDTPQARGGEQARAGDRSHEVRAVTPVSPSDSADQQGSEGDEPRTQA